MPRGKSRGRGERELPRGKSRGRGERERERLNHVEPVPSRSGPAGIEAARPVSKRPAFEPAGAVDGSAGFVRLRKTNNATVPAPDN